MQTFNNSDDLDIRYTRVIAGERKKLLVGTDKLVPVPVCYNKYLGTGTGTLLYCKVIKQKKTVSKKAVSKNRNYKKFKSVLRIRIRINN